MGYHTWTSHVTFTFSLIINVENSCVAYVCGNHDTFVSRLFDEYTF